MMTAEQLKGSILQLAMQGKLVEQRPEEGNGEDLYKEIQVEKKRLVREGKIKKGKDLPKLSEEYDIPDTWKMVHLLSVCESISDIDHKMPKAVTKENGIPFLAAKDINPDMTLNFNSDVKYISKSDFERLRKKAEPREGDIIFSRIGTLGKVGIVNNCTNFLVSYSCCVIRPMFINRKYLAYCLQGPEMQLHAKKAKTGIGVPDLGMGMIKSFAVPLPPLAEQKRIVAKIEELIPFVEQYAAASTKLNTLNATFPEMMKKSILQEAVQGKLVPQDPNDEPASVLLEKIAEEKKRLIKEGKIKKDKNTSRIVREGNSWFEFADGQKTCIDEEIPFEIPDNWSWVRLNELGDYKKGPFGSALTKSMFVPAGPNSIKVYEQKNAIQKDWTLGEYYIRKEYYEEKMSGFTVEGGDVIVSCAGTIGETYVMPDDIELGIINQALMRMKVYEPMNVDYFLMYFDYVIKATAREQSKGSAIKNIPPFAVFKRILFPMPPLSEQNRILSRLTEILLEVDKLE